MQLYGERCGLDLDPEKNDSRVHSPTEPRKTEGFPQQQLSFTLLHRPLRFKQRPPRVLELGNESADVFTIPRRL